ncbi:MAG TPA: penicillin-binding protein 2 [Thermoanaerobaculia bacterium]|nr:penicillin-binding protein 2 [Thermoanaerobaculia bacterium]
MRVYRDEQKATQLRINILMWGIVVTFFFLAGSFWYVQAVQADRFRELSESNALRAVPIRAKRGLILDRNGKILADNQPAYTLMLMRPDVRQMEKSEPGHSAKLLQFLSEALQIPVEELERRIGASKVPINQPMPLAEDLTMVQVAEVESHTLEFPAIRIEPVQRRNYRYGTMAAHVLGYIGEATEKDMEQDPTLKLADLVGKKGVELVYDKVLRGIDGTRYEVVDTHGRTLSEYSAARREPIAGRNVHLTLDFDLQRRAEQYFLDNEMVGAAVALDPRNGEILAMVSSPAFNPNVYSRRFTPDVWKTILSNPFKIEVNRAIKGGYSPGSVFKIVMGMAGFEYGVINPSTTFHCAGSASFFGRRFRCWRAQGHGDMNFERAIKVSCDIYFYNVGALLGVDRIAEYARKLTFGERTKIDLEGEISGLVPSTEWAETKQNRKWYQSETISVAIGQGPLVVTVLQTANMMAAIANGNQVMRPHVLEEIHEVRDEKLIARQVVEPEVLHEISLEPDALAAMREGLWKVVNELGGTGRNARVEGLDVCGKTGTVQVIAQSGRKQELPFKYKDHAWFASFAPKDEPEMVVVVFVEHGGGGGSDAAPLAKELFAAKFGQGSNLDRIDLSDPETLRKLREGALPQPGQPTQGR